MPVVASENSGLSAPVPPTAELSLGVIALAGAVDAVSYLHYQQVYVSFMSGNTTALSVAAATGKHHALTQLGLVIGLFVAGVVLGTWLHRAIHRQPAAAVLAAVAALLLAAYGWPPLAIEILALGMGVLNASVHQLGGLSVGLTFITGALVKVGTGLANLLSGRSQPRDWLWQALGYGCFIAGAFVGALALRKFGTVTLALAGAWALVLAWRARQVPEA